MYIYKSLASLRSGDPLFRVLHTGSRLSFGQYGSLLVKMVKVNNAAIPNPHHR